MTLRRRCAVYTRKSSEEGLEQSFNSLDAQREACEAFIKSQQHEGWSCLRDGYDDGGISGGTLERPGLQRLLTQIAEGRIDVVVVYKVDRLTRSLADFAKIVEIFDAKAVSFVSVTQQFNTTTSMGRLTLNVLLSFAQFEREVTGERIRDKIAASKKKGMWMGGAVPLGYDLRDRELVINPAEAETVRTLFRLYRELGTVRRLSEAAEQQKLITKRRESNGRVTGGGPFTRGHLYCLLANPIYVGGIAHKGATYPGRHEAIIDRPTFEAVQHQLSTNAARRASTTNTRAPSLLAGLIYDETGDRLCPTHANKQGRRYRYYISKRLMHKSGSVSSGWRLPARELETLVQEALCAFLRDELRLVEALQLGGTAPDCLRGVIDDVARAAEQLKQESAGREGHLISKLVHRIEIAANSLRFELRRSSVLALPIETPVAEVSKPEEIISFAIPFQMQRHGVEAKLVLRAPGQKRAAPNQKLIALLADAHSWLEEIAQGRAISLRDLARQRKRDAAEISRTLPLAFLAPDIVESILYGSQAVELTPRRLKRSAALGLCWNEQRCRLGFEPA